MTQPAGPVKGAGRVSSLGLAGGRESAGGQIRPETGLDVTGDSAVIAAVTDP